MAPQPERPDRAPEPDTPAARAEALSRASTALRDEEPEPVPQRALVDPKVEIRYFVSYSHEKGNRKLALDLLERLQVRFQNCPEYRFVRWIDREDIEPGDRWKKEIESAIDVCHFGLLLVSQYFLASEFITKNELPHFVAEEGGSTEPRRRAVPVGLQPIPFNDSIDLKGLREHQVFRDKEEKFYAERTGQRRERFADELFERIVSVVRKRLTVPQPPRIETFSDDDPLTRLERLQDLALQKLTGFVPTKGRRAGLDRSADPNEGPALSGEQVDAVDFLTEWAADPSAPAFCALLGDSGMGKTTTCEAFSRRLLEQRESKPNLPVPIYLDLRHLGDAAKSNPFLDDILRIVGSRSHSTGRSASESPRPDELMNLVQSGRAIAIFDGLDEVLVHLTSAQGQRFTRELWRISPPRLLPAKGMGKSEKPRGKVLISCRTHYFRSLREEQAHFLGEDREKISPSDYRALVLLPFTPQQIEEYLEKNLPGQDVENLLELIRSIHNLEEMAERPYTLKLIAEHIPKLEKWKLEGRTVTGVTLYREMVASWLERDAGKHTLTKDHKLRLMERFAAELWVSGKRTWSAEDVEQWLMDFLDGNPRVRSHYEGKDRELLKEDLRTATFLVRDGEDGFRFAHTSLQEFFLAAHLHRALRERRFEAWQIPRPSPETLDFLGQLIAEKDEAEALAAFRDLCGAYRPQASELMLAYALRARKKGLPTPVLAGARLDGAQLMGWTIAALAGSPLLDLQRASFRGANLKGTKLYRIDVRNADFRGANLSGSELIGGKGRGANFGETQLVGTVFRDLDLSAADVKGARLHRTYWLRCNLAGLSGLDGVRSAFIAGCEPATWNLQLPEEPVRLAVLNGHHGSVLSCAFSPDGACVASAGTDGTIGLWDSATGAAVNVLQGHQGVVRSCAFSLDGSRLASAGDDGSVQLWVAATGEVSRVLEGHRGRVFSCAFSPDGSRIASAGDDGTVRLWDTATGAAVQVLEGYEDWVWSCAFSPDGSRLASVGSGGAVHLWDAATGDVTNVLEGHQGSVWSCVFSPDGSRLASAGSDRTIRLWDAATGDVAQVLKVHQGIARSCVFSPDGSRLASAGDDSTVRLWDARTGDPLRSFEGHERVVWSCAFSPDGNTLASAGSDGSVRFWDTLTGDPLGALQGPSGSAISCAYSPDGSALASAGDVGTVRVWDSHTGELLRPLKHPSGGWPLSCAFSPDGAVLASAGNDGTVCLWGALTGKLLRSLQAEGRVKSCGFSPDGAVLASVGNDGILRLWDPRTGKLLRSLPGHAGGVWSCAFSPDGTVLVSAGADGTVRLWDARKGEPLHLLQGHIGEVSACAFSPNGSAVASAGYDGTVRLWDVYTGEFLRSLQGHSGEVWSCAFSPNGSAVASAGSDGTVRLWDTNTGQLLRSFLGHSAWVRSCAFSPDGVSLASVGEDSSIRVWDVATGQETDCIDFLPKGESASFFGPDLALTYASPGAWRYLGWLAPDPETGVITRYPAETFGPLPGPDANGGFRQG